MDIGIAATCCEFEDINLTAADLDDKIRRVAETSGKILQLRSCWRWLTRGTWTRSPSFIGFVG